MKSFAEGIYNNRKILATLVTVLALMVAIGTTYTLISPAATLEMQTEEQLLNAQGEEQTLEVQSEEYMMATEGTTESQEMIADVSANENGLTAEEQEQLDRVIGLIDGLPTYEEIEETILAYDEAGDVDAMQVYYNDTITDIKIAQNAYAMLDENLQAQVTNYEQLQELEGFSQMQVMMTEIKSDIPTVTTEYVASTSDFVNLNIYDYYGEASASAAGKKNINYLWTSVNQKYPGFQWNGGAYMTEYAFKPWRVDNIDFGNSMITDFTFGNYSSYNSVSDNYQKVVKAGGTINNGIGYTNQPIGYSSGSSYDALSHKLKNGYPALSDGTSLNYLFSESDYAKKLNTSNIDGLFQQNPLSGEYWFDSRDNHAYYNNDKFTLYDQLITPNFIIYPFGNFLPLNNIREYDETTSSYSTPDTTQVTKISDVKSGYMNRIINQLGSSATEKQLADMLRRYVNYSNTKLNAQQAIDLYFNNSSEFKNAGINFSNGSMNSLLSKLYNIDFDVKKNFMFGMDMSMNFMQPKNGLAGNDTNNDGISDYPMKFYFAGDDDVWVFIDDVLFLDLTGIHRHVGGDIDFQNGIVNYYMMKSYVDGQVKSTPYATYTFAEILTDIGGVPASELGNYLKKDGSGNYTTFKDYSTHKFNFYYMERGTGSSVCCINFNFPLLKKNTISVSKEVMTDVETLGNPDFSFQILKAGANGTKTKELFIGAGTEYIIYDSSDNEVGTGTVDSNGVFRLKAGQRAEFSDISENSGKYYVRELFEKGFSEQYESVKVSGVSATFTENNIAINEVEFVGADSPVKDCSEGATKFIFENDIDELKLGGLQIRKTVADYNNNPTEKVFEFDILLDGEKLATGTEYTVTKAGVTKTEAVNTPGIIELTHGETAVISNIKAGTQFQVTEVGESADSYSTTYELEGQALGGTVPAGFIKPATNTSVAVTNDEYGTSINIPVTKTVINANGSEKTFTFRIQEVDVEGNAVEGGHSAENVLSMNGNSSTLDFPLTYRASKQKEREKTYYYKITEVSDGNDKFIYDPSAYIAEVKVIKENKQLSVAEPLKIYKIENDQWTEVEDITFNNEQLYSLEVAKSVTGREDDNTQFSFTISLNGNDKKVFNFEKFSGAELIDSGVVDFSNGSVDIELQDTQKCIIQGLPAGVEWTISEKGTLSDGYIAKFKVNDGQQFTRGLTATSIVAPENEINGVTFENEVCYTLPETGGVGTKPFYIGGLLMIAVAGVLLMRQRKREV